MESPTWEIRLWMTLDAWILRLRHLLTVIQQAEQRWLPWKVREPAPWMWVVFPILAFGLGLAWGLWGR